MWLVPQSHERITPALKRKVANLVDKFESDWLLSPEEPCRAGDRDAISASTRSNWGVCNLRECLNSTIRFQPYLQSEIDCNVYYGRVFDVSLIPLETTTPERRKYPRPPHKVGLGMHCILPHIFRMPIGGDKPEMMVSPPYPGKLPSEKKSFFSENKFRD